MDLIQIITFAAIGGIIPCLFWLVFWLREAHDHPEPPGDIVACFVGGMLVTLIVYPFQKLIMDFFPLETTLSITLLVCTEEIGKLAICWFLIFRKGKSHNPIDAVIFMISVALGFAAFENTLYLLDPLMDNDLLGGFILGNTRFVGPALLHTLSSAVIGVFLAFAFFKNPLRKEEYGAIGLFFAIVLHTLFNFFILRNDGAHIFLVFASVWLLIIMLIVLFEKVKTITNTTT